MTGDDSLTIEPLGKRHDRAAFSCGVDELDGYLQKQAGQDVRRRVARVFVCCRPNGDAVIGFYTLSALSVALDGLPESMARKLPRHPVPAALIGRLAVAVEAQGQGIGRLLLADAIKRVLGVGETVAIHALVVDAKDEPAKRFYETFGFLPFPDQARRLFLPLASVAGSLG